MENITREGLDALCRRYHLTEEEYRELKPKFTTLPIFTEETQQIVDKVFNMFNFSEEVFKAILDNSTFIMNDGIYTQTYRIQKFYSYGDFTMFTHNKVIFLENVAITDNKESNKKQAGDKVEIREQYEIDDDDLTIKVVYMVYIPKDRKNELVKHINYMEKFNLSPVAEKNGELEFHIKEKDLTNIFVEVFKGETGEDIIAGEYFNLEPDEETKRLRCATNDGDIPEEAWESIGELAHPDEWYLLADSVLCRVFGVNDVSAYYSGKTKIKIWVSKEEFNKRQ